MPTEIKTIQYDLGNYDITPAEVSGAPSWAETVFTFTASTTSFTDITSTAQSRTSFNMAGTNNIGDIIYIGHTYKFNQLSLRMSSSAPGGTRVLEYWNGAWVTIPEIFTTINSLSLTQTNMTEAVWIPPLDWSPTNVNGVTEYWVRLRTTVAPSSAGVMVCPIRIKTIVNENTKGPYFNKVFRALSGDSGFVDVTSGAYGNGSSFGFNTANGDLLYLGSTKQFGGVAAFVATGSSGTKIWEFYSAATSGWETITPTFTDGNTSFNTSSQNVKSVWDPLPNWSNSITINGVSNLYWIRLRNSGTVGAGSIDYFSCGNFIELPAKTIYIPENTNRTIHNAFVRLNFKHGDDVGDIRYFKAEMKAGNGNWTNVFLESRGISDTAEQTPGCYVFPVTSFLNSNFGSGTSQTIQLRISSPSNSGAASGSSHIENENISAELYITYEAELQNTRIKTIKIPLDAFNITTAGDMSAIWRDIDSIPSLNSFLPENSKVYRDIYTVLCANENTATSPHSYSLEVICGNDIKRLNLSSNSAQSGNTLFYTLNWTNTIDVSASNCLSARVWEYTTTSTVQNKFTNASGYMVVTYEYNEANSTTILNSLELPFSYDTGQEKVKLASQEDPQSAVEYLCNENNPVMKRSGMFASWSAGTGGGTFTINGNVNGYSRVVPPYLRVVDGGSFINFDGYDFVGLTAYDDLNDIIYIGSPSKFNVLNITNAGTGNGHFVWEYWNGSSWDTVMTAFDAVQINDSSAGTWTNLTSTASDYKRTGSGNSFNTIFKDLDDALYIGSANKFCTLCLYSYGSGAVTRAGGTLAFEYSNGNGVWLDATPYLTVNIGNVNLTSAENVFRFAPPNDWNLQSLAGASVTTSLYYVRLRVLTSSTTDGNITAIMSMDKFSPLYGGMLQLTPNNVCYDISDDLMGYTEVNGTSAYWIRGLHPSSGGRSGGTNFTSINFGYPIAYTYQHVEGSRFISKIFQNSISKGYNLLTLFSSPTTAVTSFAMSGVFILNYTSDKMTDSSRHNKTIQWCNDVFSVTQPTGPLTTKSDIFYIPRTESIYYLNSFGGNLFGINDGNASTLFTVTVNISSNEITQNDLTRLDSLEIEIGDNLIQSIAEVYNFTTYYNDHHSLIKKYPGAPQYVDIFKPRGVNIRWNNSNPIFNHVIYTTYNTIANTYTLRVLGYTGDGSGIPVEIYNSYDEKIMSLTTTAGGVATYYWYLDNDQLYAKATQGIQFGISKLTNVASEEIKIHFKKPAGFISG